MPHIIPWRVSRLTALLLAHLHPESAVVLCRTQASVSRDWPVVLHALTAGAWADATKRPTWMDRRRELYWAGRTAMRIVQPFPAQSAPTDHAAVRRGLPVSGARLKRSLNGFRRRLSVSCVGL